MVALAIEIPRSMQVLECHQLVEETVAAYLELLTPSGDSDVRTATADRAPRAGPENRQRQHQRDVPRPDRSVRKSRELERQHLPRIERRSLTDDVGAPLC